VSARKSLIIGFVAIIIALAGAGSASVQDAHACSCEPPLEPEEEYERVDYIFAGEVVQISDPDSDNYVDVHFEVSKSWKGVGHREISFGTAADGDACGFDFSEGSEYLVYASDNDAGYGPDIVTGICRLTGPLIPADDELMVLGTGTDAEELEEGEQGNGLDLWVLFGSIALFLAIVVAIQLLRRWR
jgi:hypothetical protein